MRELAHRTGKPTEMLKKLMKQKVVVRDMPSHISMSHSAFEKAVHKAVKNDGQPGKIEKLFCKGCGEILIKIYPWCPGWNTPRMGLFCKKPECQKKLSQIIPF